MIRNPTAVRRHVGAPDAGEGHRRALADDVLAPDHRTVLHSVVTWYCVVQEMSAVWCPGAWDELARARDQKLRRPTTVRAYPVEIVRTGRSPRVHHTLAVRCPHRRNRASCQGELAQRPARERIQPDAAIAAERAEREPSAVWRECTAR